jgi:hypothetical protein
MTRVPFYSSGPYSLLAAKVQDFASAGTEKGGRRKKGSERLNTSSACSDSFFFNLS